VSEWERAIYNPDGWLKTVFSKIPPGARLYIDRVSQTRYQLHLKPNRHLVRNCKFPEKDGAGGWKFTDRDEWIDWESDDDIFRHQVTFTQMDALFAEAEHTNWSVRDAVHDFMKRFAQNDPWHVRDIYEYVFRWMRTCSLAAVWAQFRPEHECYERAGASRYIFNPTGAFPRVRVFPRADQDDRHAIEGDEIGRADPTRVRMAVHWSRILNEPCEDEFFKGDSSGVLYAQFLGSLLAKRPGFTERLTREDVSRFPLSSTPDTCFMNSQNNRPYPKRPVPGTQPQLYLCTQGGTDEMRRHILDLAERLHFPKGSVEVFITPHMTAHTARAAFLASI
jgi:hypothetical protein